MDKGITVGIDARLSGVANAGLGRHIMNLAAYLPIFLPDDWHLVYFFEELAQLAEVSNLVETLPSKLQRQALAGMKRMQAVVTPVGHYGWAEQLKMPGYYKQARLDLLHVPHFNLPYLASATHIVVTIHDLLWHEKRGRNVTTLPAWQYALKYFAYRRLVDHTVAAADAIITPSQNIRTTVERFYPSASQKIKVIYNGVTPWSADAAEVSVELPWSDYFLYVGSLYPHKNVDLVLQVLRDDPELHLVVVSARNAFTENFIQKVTQYGLQERVLILGKQTDQQLRSLYRHALALLQPSLSEGFGLTGVEAMNCGCPVVASQIPIFAEIYADAAVNFDPKSAKSLVVALQTVHGWTPRERQKAITAGYRQAGRYSWERMARETMTLYQTLVKK